MSGTRLTSTQPSRPRGLRREALVLLPVSLLLFAALASVTLHLYRSAVSRLLAEREAWTLRQAVALAERAHTLPRGAFDELAALVPVGSAIALHDARGEVVWSRGFAESERANWRPAPAERSGAARVDADELARSGYLVALAPFAPAAPASTAAPGAELSRWLVRLESPAPALAAERRTLAVLTPVVLVLSTSVAILALVFLWALNRPYALLLERALEAAPAAARSPGAGDEIDFLLATFDRALAALRASDSDPTGTARHDAEARLAESVAQLGELSAGVAHELRNSLGTLEGYLGLLARRELPEPAREELAEARRETEALARTVDDFLAFARPGLRALDEIELGDLVERALADPSLAGCRFELAREPGSIRLPGDERLLKRALRNLLLNAAQAQARSGARSAVEVRVSVARERARVEIRDRGPGIAPELAGRLFEPFASGRSGGAGLGLALARRIVLLHGGQLRLEDRPDGGASALLELPLGKSAT